MLGELSKDPDQCRVLERVIALFGNAPLDTDFSEEPDKSTPDSKPESPKDAWPGGGESKNKVLPSWGVLAHRVKVDNAAKYL